MTDDQNFQPTRQFWFGADKCKTCGTELKPGWTFCGTCGTPVPTQAPTPAQAPGPPRADEPEPPAIFASALAAEPEPQVGTAESRRGPSRRVLAVVLALTVVLAIAGWGLELKKASDLDQRTKDLNHTKATLATTAKNLTSTTDDLNSTRTTLTNTEADLKSTKSDLEKAKRGLTGAEHRLDLQAGQISTLKICLGGVQRALSDLAYNDFESALSELEAVQTACRKANDIV